MPSNSPVKAFNLSLDPLIFHFPIFNSTLAVERVSTKKSLILQSEWEKSREYSGWEFSTSNWMFNEFPLWFTDSLIRINNMARLMWWAKRFFSHLHFYTFFFLQVDSNDFSKSSKQNQLWKSNNFVLRIVNESRIDFELEKFMLIYIFSQRIWAQRSSIEITSNVCCVRLLPTLRNLCASSCKNVNIEDERKAQIYARYTRLHNKEMDSTVSTVFVTILV